MKHIFLVALALFTLNVTAQQQNPQQRKGDRKERPQRMQKFADFTPEEIAELRTKKMVLDFDLTDTQQKEVYKLNLKEAKERKQMMDERKAKMEARRNDISEGKVKREKLSKEERFNMVNNKLDKQIAHKKEMKSILNKDQFEKWEKVSKARFNKNKKAVKQKIRNGKRPQKNIRNKK